jgi:hypothetical protein
MTEARSSSDWAAIDEVQIISPDGWDRVEFARSWAEPITWAEYQRRRNRSTCKWAINKAREV